MWLLVMMIHGLDLTTRIKSVSISNIPPIKSYVLLNFDSYYKGNDPYSIFVFQAKTRRDLLKLEERAGQEVAGIVTMKRKEKALVFVRGILVSVVIP
jgi:hypothetical protein